MRGSIRKTDFTWDPEHQSRQAIWKQLKAHLESELARIEAASKQHARRRRLLASPTYHRDRAILHDHEALGASAMSLARTYGVTHVRIREILRVTRHRERILRLRPRLPRAPVAELPHRGLPDLPGGIPQTGDMMKDP